MLKSRSMWPPNGWQFHEAATGWRLPPGLTFRQSVEAIVNHRRQNAQYQLDLLPANVAQALDDFTCARLRFDPAWCVANAPASFPLPRPLSPPWAGAKNAADGNSWAWLRNTATGIKVWLEWFGTGQPVARPLAEKRAAICATCPKNESVTDLKTRFSKAAAEEILAVMGALKDLELQTQHDDKLAVCVACDCPLKAKVWAPLDIIKKNLLPDVVAKLDPQCWIIHEKHQKDI